LNTARGAFLAIAFGMFTCGAAGAADVPAQKPAVKTAPAKPAPEKAKPESKAPAAEKAVAPKPADGIGKPIESDAADENAKSDAKGSAAASLPIPRFVSLRTNPINLRAGPGVRYPVDWVYVRRSLPVEVIGEFDTWRRIRDPDGAEGWVHQSMLSGKRTAIVTGGNRALMRTADAGADTLVTLEAGVIVNVQRCPPDIMACRVEINGLQGWLPREHFWGVYPRETVE